MKRREFLAWVGKVAAAAVVAPAVIRPLADRGGGIVRIPPRANRPIDFADWREVSASVTIRRGKTPSYDQILARQVEAIRKDVYANVFASNQMWDAT